MKKWKIDCVIYDCDGVLFDSLEQNRKLYDHIATSAGREPLSDEEINFCHSHTVYESISYVFRDNEAMEKKAVDYWKNNINFADFIPYLKMEPNLIEVLAKLREQGITRAINTNRTTSMKYIMEAYGLYEYFDTVVTALDVENPKPHPESVEKILKMFNKSRDDVLFVGDSDVDRKTARSSGVKFIAYKNKDLEADGFIDDHLNLLAFLSNAH